MVQIFAHRGFSGYYPENTMLAFQKVAEETVADGYIPPRCTAVSVRD